MDILSIKNYNIEHTLLDVCCLSMLVAFTTRLIGQQKKNVTRNYLRNLRF